MHRLLRIAVLPIAFAAAPASAATLFDFEIRGTFSGVTIAGSLVDEEVTISGSSAPTTWDGSSPVVADILPGSLTLRYGGVDIGAVQETGPFFYGLLGSAQTTAVPPQFLFGINSSGDLDFRPNTAVDSILFATSHFGTPAWIGFGGSIAGQSGPGAQGARRLSITTAISGGVVQFGPSAILQTLEGDETARVASATFAAPIPLPAAGWLLLAAMGGLATLARRRVTGRA